MKKLIVSIGAAIMLFCTSAVFAQAQAEERANPVAKGNLVIKLFDMGYSFARSGDLYESNDAAIFGINDSHAGSFYDRYFPLGTELNYFIIDGFAIGGSLHYANTEMQNGEKVDFWSFGPSLYYYYTLSNEILPYATLSYIYSKVKGDMSTDIDFQRIPLAIGITLMVGRNIGIYAQFAYAFNQLEDTSVDVKGTMAMFSAGVKAFF